MWLLFPIGSSAGWPGHEGLFRPRDSVTLMQVPRPAGNSVETMLTRLARPEPAPHTSSVCTKKVC